MMTTKKKIKNNNKKKREEKEEKKIIERRKACASSFGHKTPKTRAPFGSGFAGGGGGVERREKKDGRRGREPKGRKTCENFYVISFNLCSIKSVCKAVSRLALKRTVL